MLALVSMESLVPSSHPLRAVKRLVDEVLAELDPVFAGMYAAGGRPSVAPERLLKASVLMALYSVRSERLFCEQLGYNMLFRWFLDMTMVEDAFDPSSFSHNRDRLLEHDVARKFFDHVVDRARRDGLLSSAHLGQWHPHRGLGSPKSFRSREGDTQDNGGLVNFRGEKRRNDTHVPKTAPETRLYRKGHGKEARLAHMGHVLIENRHGLVVDAEVTEANGTAERDAALAMLQRERRRREKRARKRQSDARKQGRKGRRPTVAADKGYDTKDFVRRCRDLRATPHVARNIHARHRSAIDGRTLTRPGYRMSGTARLLVGKAFGWPKAYGGLRRTRFRGKKRTENATLVSFATLNLLRIANLSTRWPETLRLAPNLPKAAIEPHTAARPRVPGPDSGGSTIAADAARRVLQPARDRGLPSRCATFITARAASACRARAPDLLRPDP